MTIKTFNRNCIILLTLTMMVSASLSQDYFEWERSFGVAADDKAQRCIQTGDGGYLYIGTTNHFDLNHNEHELHILKLDNDYETDWTLHIPSDGTDVCSDALESNDGYVLVGQTTTYNERGDRAIHGRVWKLTPEGELQWDWTYPQRSTSIQRVFPHPDDVDLFYCFVSQGGTSMLIIDADGDIQRTIGLGGEGYPLDALLIQDGFVVLRKGTGRDGWYLIKHDFDGEEIFNNEFLENINRRTYQKLLPLADGRFVISGIENNVRILAMLSDEGELEWDESYPTEDNFYGSGSVLIDDGRIVSVQGYYDFTLQIVNFDGEASLNTQFSHRPHGHYPRNLVDAFLTRNNILSCFGIVRTGGRDEGRDLLVTEVNLNGSVDYWDELGFPGGSMDIARDVKLFDDGEIIILAETDRNNAGSFDPLIMKLDADGEEDWTKSTQFPGTQNCTDIIQDDAGGYFMAGSCENPANFWLSQTDHRGDTLWIARHELWQSPTAHEMIQTTDGGFIIVGGRHRGNGILLDEDGSLMASIINYDDEFVSVTELPDNRYAFLAEDGLITVTNNRLREIDSYSGFVEGYDRPAAVKLRVAPDGDILFLGTTSNRGNPTPAVIARFHPDGELVWSQLYENIDLEYYDGEGNYVKADFTILNDSTMYVCANKNLVSLTLDGWITARLDIEGFGHNDEAHFNSWNVSENGDILLTGIKNNDVWLAQISAASFAYLEAKNTPLLPLKFSIECFPNPFNSSIAISYGVSHSGWIELNVFNNHGQKLLSIPPTYCSTGVFRQHIDFAKLPTGSYIISLSTGTISNNVWVTHLR